MGQVPTCCEGDPTGTARIPLAGGEALGPIRARPALEHPASSKLPADKPRTSPGEAVGFPACKAQLPPCSLMIIIKRAFNSVPHFPLLW